MFTFECLTFGVVSRAGDEDDVLFSLIGFFPDLLALGKKSKTNSSLSTVCRVIHVSKRLIKNFEA
jgi:hypothetical protein